MYICFRVGGWEKQNARVRSRRLALPHARPAHDARRPGAVVELGCLISTLATPPCSAQPSISPGVDCLLLVPQLDTGGAQGVMHRDLFEIEPRGQRSQRSTARRAMHEVFGFGGVVRVTHPPPPLPRARITDQVTRRCTRDGGRGVLSLSLSLSLSLPSLPHSSLALFPCFFLLASQSSDQACEPAKHVLIKIKQSTNYRLYIRAQLARTYSCY